MIRTTDLVEYLKALTLFARNHWGDEYSEEIIKRLRAYDEIKSGTEKHQSVPMNKDELSIEFERCFAHLSYVTPHLYSIRNEQAYEQIKELIKKSGQIK